jgi:two-component sensor histidine kinase
MGEARDNDYIDLATLELVFAFPGLILHTVRLETAAAGNSRGLGRGWQAANHALYGAGLIAAVYFAGAILDLLPGPRILGPYIGMTIGSLFTAASVACLWLMGTSRRASATRDERRLRASLMFLFVAMIVVFLVLSFMRERARLIEVLDVAVRTTPLLFLLVSVYWENRTEFYDLVVKRGVIMLLSLLLLATAFAIGLGWLEAMPGGAVRPWLFAVALLPVAMTLPWLHGHVGRLLDRLWFGREFTPVEAVKHVLGGMQQATDEASLIAATERTLSDMFRRRVSIVLGQAPLPERMTLAASVRASASSERIRLATVNDPGTRPLLSEDHALLRSLASVFAFMLENVRLQRKRQEQEQVAQELRLQTSRSELKALRAQINPHFLFNALNAIASLIHTDPTRADAAVEQLAEVFRYTLRRSEQEWAPLDQELAFARAYLDVEQARFGRRLEFSIDADPALAAAQVPSMLLQTLVENAVKHGISQLRSQGRIEIAAARNGSRPAGDGRRVTGDRRRETGDGKRETGDGKRETGDRRRASGDTLLLEVRDTGPGPDRSARSPHTAGESFGLRSVRDRLHGHFGDHASLELVREENVTVARIRMPLVLETAAAGTPE